TVTLRLTVTDSGPCANHIRTDDVILTVNQVLASSSNTPILCHGGNSTVTVSASGGLTPYAGTGTFSHAAGTYSYTVTDAHSCTATTTGTISEPSALSASSSNTAILCNGGNSIVKISRTWCRATDNVTGTYSPGAGTYTYTVRECNSRHG